MLWGGFYFVSYLMYVTLIERFQVSRNRTRPHNFMPLKASLYQQNRRVSGQFRIHNTEQCFSYLGPRNPWGSYIVPKRFASTCYPYLSRIIATFKVLSTHSFTFTRE